MADAGADLVTAVVTNPTGFKTVDRVETNVRGRLVAYRTHHEQGAIIHVSEERFAEGLAAGQLERVEGYASAESEPPVEGADTWRATDAIAYVEEEDDVEVLTALGEYEQGHENRVTVLRAIADRLEVLEATAATTTDDAGASEGEGATEGEGEADSGEGG